MAFDLESARKAGYSDAEIADHLAATRGFDIAGARKSGYTDAELVQHLATAAPKDTTPPGQIPIDTRLKAPPAIPQDSTSSKIIRFISPTVEGLGAVAGGTAGIPFGGPVGATVGAGMGYAGAKSALRTVNRLLGNEPPPNSLADAVIEPATDVAFGTTMERGGQLLGKYVVPPLVKGAGWIADAVSGNLANVKAAMIANKAAAPTAASIQNQLASAPADMTAAQATTGTYNPVWQALNERASLRDPIFYGPGPLTTQQRSMGINALESAAGGPTATAARKAEEGAVDNLNQLMTPIRNIELEAANTAGKLKPKLDAEAQRFGDAAAAKVEDVRRFTAAGQRAADRANNTNWLPPKVPGEGNDRLIGMPLVPGRYTYMGELEKAAERVAQQAADASLPFGEAARFAKAASDSLEAHGLRPLKTDTIVAALDRVMRNPRFAGNDDIAKVIPWLKKDLAQWTNNNGVIDAYALEAIRKNSVNGAIRDLLKGQAPDVQAQAASSVMVNIKPIIDDAMEAAGGTGWREYLKNYSKSRQLISQSKMSAQALDMFKNNPKAFVELVQGNSPDKVEKIFGHGSYDFAKEMAETLASKPIAQIADRTGRGLEAASQADAGRAALEKIIADSFIRFKIPWGLSPKTMAMNKALDMLEHKIGTKTMNALAEGLKNGRSAQEMMSVMPTWQRNQIMNALASPEIKWPAGTGAAAVNALTPSN